MDTKNNYLHIPELGCYGGKPFIVQITDTGCWIPSSHRKRVKGYSTVWRDKKDIAVHRLSFESFIGDIPEGYCICHHCDNPPCVNPAHLFAGTRQDNTLDMFSKSRGNILPPRAKLTPLQVREIRELYQSGVYTYASLAKRFNVVSSTIHFIVNRINWKSLNDVEGEHKCHKITQRKPS